MAVIIMHKNADEIRNIFANYFMNEGQVPWQELMI